MRALKLSAAQPPGSGGDSATDSSRAESSRVYSTLWDQWDRKIAHALEHDERSATGAGAAAAAIPPQPASHEITGDGLVPDGQEERGESTLYLSMREHTDVAASSLSHAGRGVHALHVWADQGYDVSYSGARVRGANLSDRPEAF